jgi:hypothetical protein
LRFPALFLAVSFCGCAPYLTNWGQAATGGALADLGSDAGARELAAAASLLASAAVAAALNPATDAELQALARDTATAAAGAGGAEARAQAALFLEAFRPELHRMLVEEGAALQCEVAALREEAVGAPLRADVAALLAEEGPLVTELLATMLAKDGPLVAALLQQAATQAASGALVTLKADADAEEKAWRPVAEGLGAGCVALVVLLGAAALEARRRGQILKAVVGPS